MKRLLAVLLLAGLVVLMPRPAFACSCADVGPAAYVDYADVVVEATVTGVDREGDGRGNASYDLDVHGVFKGVARDRVVMQSTGGEGMCGIAAFGRGDRAVFFLGRDGDELTSNLCAGNGFATVQQVERLLGEPAVPSAAATPDSPERVVIDEDEDAQVAWSHPAVLGPVAGVALLGVVGVVLLRRRRP